ncbi:MAG: 30S ribosomal protein S2 [Pseudomonadota bacterium]
MSNISMKAMLEAGIHFGHQQRYWNPKMAPYIYGSRNRIHIINLEETLPLFQQVLHFVKDLAAKKGKILFVGTKRSAQKIIKQEAQRCEMPYVDYRWLGGMLTNYKTIRQSIKKLKQLEDMQETGAFDKLIKKEALAKQREMEKLKRSLDGIKNMGGLPDALFVIDVGYEYIAVEEARRLKIPVIGVVDTNNSPDGIDYLIPGNDDAMRSIQFYCQNMADAILEGKASARPTTEAEEFVEVSEDETEAEAKAVAANLDTSEIIAEQIDSEAIGDK